MKLRIAIYSNLMSNEYTALVIPANVLPHSFIPTNAPKLCKAASRTAVMALVQKAFIKTLAWAFDPCKDNEDWNSKPLRKYKSAEPWDAYYTDIDFQ